MNTVYVNQYGVKAGEDVTLPLYALMQKYPKDTTFIFDKGDYCFTPQFTYDYRLSNSDRIPERKLGIWLRGMENVKFDFSGSTLWFAGQMQPFTVDHCTHVEIANAAINWEKPLVAEGVVTAFGDGYIDMFIDPSLYPHRIQDGRLEFDTGNDEWYALCCPHSQIQFDEMSRTVRRNSGDRFSPTRVEELGGSIYRFYANDTLNTAVGNIFVLRHNARIHAGCFLEKSEDVTLTDITFYSCGGLGCLAQFCHHLTFRRVHFLPDMKRGRKVANGRDDGMHITCCSGKITITECSFTGLMDDPINVHSCCCTVSEVIDDHTIRCRYMHHQATAFHYWAEPGDEIVFIERRHMT
ncbi:MAG: right-handed parallel beta-helix repeat-containing protein, partial [Clostridia bacterium]|nr:right-handed parallel beta-helix repeat-containing protein [Clostridia bacterium]